MLVALSNPARRRARHPLAARCGECGYTVLVLVLVTALVASAMVATSLSSAASVAIVERDHKLASLAFELAHSYALRSRTALGNALPQALDRYLASLPAGVVDLHGLQIPPQHFDYREGQGDQWGTVDVTFEIDAPKTTSSPKGLPGGTGAGATIDSYCFRAEFQIEAHVKHASRRMFQMCQLWAFLETRRPFADDPGGPAYPGTILQAAW
jgi:hypothetical protein